MTDREILLHRFSHKNMKKSTGELAKYLGVPRKEYEAACERAMAAEADALASGNYKFENGKFVIL